MGLTQSAMSHRLRRLRSLFDDPLLVGGRNGMVPTPRAQSLVAPLRDGLRQLRGIWANAQPFDPATSRREFVVISADICEFGILPAVLARLEVRAPHVTVRMLEPWAGMFAALEEGRADLYVGGPLDAPAGFVQKAVAEDGFACLVRADHPEVGDSLDLQTYLSLGHLMITAGAPDDVSPVDQVLTARGLQRRVVMRIPHFLGAPHMAARSNLIVTTSAALARYAVEILPLRMLPCPLPMPTTRAFETWHERFNRDPAHRWLRQLSADCTQEVLGPLSP
jgi:DNA-binding transcriptional LysR family regulator